MSSNQTSKIKVIHGNCLDILPKITEKILIVTDPPFNIGYHYNDYKDNMGSDEYYQMLQEVFQNAP